jgi:hypothetical protein
VQGTLAELEQHAGKAHAHAAMKADLDGVEFPVYEPGESDFFAPTDWRAKAQDGRLQDFKLMVSSDVWTEEALEAALDGANPRPDDVQVETGGYLHYLTENLNVDKDGKAEQTVASTCCSGNNEADDHASEVAKGNEIYSVGGHQYRSKTVFQGTTVQVVERGWGLLSAWNTVLDGGAAVQDTAGVVAGGVSSVTGMDKESQWFSLLATVLRTQVTQRFPRTASEYKHIVPQQDSNFYVAGNKLKNVVLHGMKVWNDHAVKGGPLGAIDYGGCFFALDRDSSDHLKGILSDSRTFTPTEELILVFYWEQGTLIDTAIEATGQRTGGKNFWGVSNGDGTVGVMGFQINYIGINIAGDRQWLEDHQFNTRTLTSGNKGENTAIAVSAVTVATVDFSR